MRAGSSLWTMGMAVAIGLIAATATGCAGSDEPAQDPATAVNPTSNPGEGDAADDPVKKNKKKKGNKETADDRFADGEIGLFQRTLVGLPHPRVTYVDPTAASIECARTLSFDSESGMTFRLHQPACGETAESTVTGTFRVRSLDGTQYPVDLYVDSAEGDSAPLHVMTFDDTTKKLSHGELGTFERTDRDQPRVGPAQ